MIQMQTMNYSGDLPLYQQLAQSYIGAIEKGSLPAGVRLPSVRELMQRHAVSLSTALQMLRWLEGRGWAVARPRVGYFVQNRQAALGEVPEPDMRAPLTADPARYAGINARISTMLDSGRRADIRVDLGGATPGIDLFDARFINLAAAALLRERPNIWLESRVIAGTHPEFQVAMARRAVDDGVHLAPQDVMATSGNSEAVHLALSAVAQPGDVIAVESPTFYGLLQVIESHGLRALEIPCSQHTGISLEALELASRSEPRLKAIVVTPDLQMPLGTLMPDANKAALAQFCRDRNLALIEDNSYRLFVELGQPTRPVKAWDTSGHVIYCESFNKTLAPGLRQGWMNAGRWHDRVQMLKFAQTRTPPSFGQLLVARLTASGTFARHLQRMRTTLRGQRERAAQAIAQHFPPGTRLRLPPGGLTLWVELPAGVPSGELFTQALQRGIRTAPGSLFSNTGRYDSFMRFGCTHAFTDAIGSAYRELGQLTATLQQ